MQTTPSNPVGTRSNSMIVVRCSKCGHKRWANIMRDRKQARTTCCGEIIQISQSEVVK